MKPTNVFDNSESRTPTVIVSAYPEVSDGVVYTLDAHYSQMPSCRGGIERTMIVEKQTKGKDIR